MRISKKRRFKLMRRVTLVGVMACTAFGVAQQVASNAEQASAAARPESSSASVNDSVRELREQVRELQAAVAGMRSDWQQARAEFAELRRELDEIRTGEVRAGTERNAVLRDAVATAAPINSGAAANMLPNAVQNDAPQYEKPDQNEDQQKAERATRLDEEYQLLSGIVDEQYLTKVDSAS